MRSELLSAARPTRLRLIGFLALVAGAALAGVGSILTWATVGFPRDVGHAVDVTYKGVDVWEGVVVLFVAVAVLTLTIAMRMAASTTARSAMAGLVGVAGAAVAGLAGVDLATATDRFGGAESLDRLARETARRLGQPVDSVRALLEQSFGADLRVDVGAGIPLALAGGVVLILAGALALAWARERPLSGRPSEPERSDRALGAPSRPGTDA